MTMIKIEVPNSDIEALDLAGEFFTKLAQSRRSFITSAQAQVWNETVEEMSQIEPEPNIESVSPHVHVGVTEGEVTPRVPSVPPVPSVPTPIVPPVPSVPVPSEIDKTALPYDERIHSSGETRNQDGTWKLRRRPTDMTEEEWKEFIDKCELENSKLMTVGADIVDSDDPVITFEELMKQLQKHLLNPDFMPECLRIVKELGLEQIADLRKATHLIPEFLRQLDLEGKGVTA